MCRSQFGELTIRFGSLRVKVMAWVVYTNHTEQRKAKPMKILQDFWNPSRNGFEEVVIIRTWTCTSYGETKIGSSMTVLQPFNRRECLHLASTFFPQHHQWIKHQGRENNGNDRQLKKPSISRQILLFSIVEKCGRQYRNMHVDIRDLGDKRPCY